MLRLLFLGWIPIALFLVAQAPVATANGDDGGDDDADRDTVETPASMWLAGSWRVVTEEIEPEGLPDDLPPEMSELVKQLVGNGRLQFDVDAKTLTVSNLPRIPNESHGSYQDRWRTERDEVSGAITWHGIIDVVFDDEERRVTFQVSLRQGEQNRMQLRYDGLPVAALPLRHVPVSTIEFDPARAPEYLVGTWEIDIEYMLEHYAWVREQLGDVDPDLLRDELPRMRITQTDFYTVSPEDRSERHEGEYIIEGHEGALLLVTLDPSGFDMEFRMLFLSADRIRVGELDTEEVQVWRRYVPPSNDDENDEDDADE